MSSEPTVEMFIMRHRKDLIVIPRDPKLDPPPHTCIKCWQPGHVASKCSAKIEKELCFNCGRQGVKMSNCPRCHLAWRKNCSKDGDNKQQKRERDRDHQQQQQQQQSMISNSNGDGDGLLPQPTTLPLMAAQQSYPPSTWSSVQSRLSPGGALQQQQQQKQQQQLERSPSEMSLHSVRVGYASQQQQQQQQQMGAKATVTAAVPSNDHGSADKDPLLELAQLLDSIKHLSVETQDLVVKQMMLERKDKLERRRLEYASTSIAAAGANVPTPASVNTNANTTTAVVATSSTIDSTSNSNRRLASNQSTIGGGGGGGGGSRQGGNNRNNPQNQNQNNQQQRYGNRQNEGKRGGGGGGKGSRGYANGGGGKRRNEGENEDEGGGGMRLVPEQITSDFAIVRPVFLKSDDEDLDDW